MSWVTKDCPVCGSTVLIEGEKAECPSCGETVEKSDGVLE